MAHIQEEITKTKGKAYDVHWPDQDGRPRQKRFYKKREGEAYRSPVETELNEGKYIDPRAGRLTFREVAEEWLATRTRCKPRTVDKYRALLERCAFRDLGSRRINTITAGHIGALVTSLKLTERGATRRPAGIARIMYPVKGVLRYAEDHGWIARNPARMVELPDADTLGVDEFEGVALTPAQVAMLAGQRSIVAHPFGSLLVQFTAGMGLRAGELAGLRIRHINRLKRTVGVEKTWSIRHGEDTPKSKRSRRTVPLDFCAPAAEAALFAYLDAHPFGDDPDAPLFYGRERRGRPVAGKHWDSENFVKRVYKPAVRALGMPELRLHDLRHTAGSIWLAAGNDMITVSRMLGHSSTAITEAVYAHVYEEDLAASGRRVREYLAAKSKDESKIRTLPVAS